MPASEGFVERRFGRYTIASQPGRHVRIEMGSAHHLVEPSKARDIAAALVEAADNAEREATDVAA